MSEIRAVQQAARKHSASRVRALEICSAQVEMR
jgi:hypothetical protein